jgi:hypothetical protein
MSVQIKRTSKLVQVADMVSAIHDAETLLQKLKAKGREEEATELEHMTETVISIAALFLRHRFAALNLAQYGAFNQLQEYLERQQSNVQRR